MSNNTTIRLTLWDGSRDWWPPRRWKYLLFKSIFFHTDVWCWHFAVAASLGMILGAQKTLAQGLFNEPKYVRNDLWSSELWLSQYHKVNFFFQERKIIKIDKLYRNPYCKKKTTLKKWYLRVSSFVSHHIWDGSRDWWPYTAGNCHLFKKRRFFLAHVWCCHFTVAAIFSMILGALKRRWSLIYNEPKIIQNLSAVLLEMISKNMFVEYLTKFHWFW